MSSQEQQKSTQQLRKGFTTGTSAAAAAKAAVYAILNQKKPSQVVVLLPKGGTIAIKIESCEFSEYDATASVIKDGGDDPDVTHGTEIRAQVLVQDENPGNIEIYGGEGVGKITKTGIGLDIGAAAINPVPRKMITENTADAATEFLKKHSLRVTISVPNGKELAPKTDNPRLGIVGGISILGTTGIVIPYSTASFAAAIRQGIDVTKAAGDDKVVLTTGGRSEDFAKNALALSDHCYVQMGDFAGYAIQQCAKMSIKTVYVSGFIGKLAKIAKGVKQTHVKGSKVDMSFLSELARKCGADYSTIQEIKAANTARHVFEIVNKKKVGGFFDTVCFEVAAKMSAHCKDKANVCVIMFDFDGNIIGSFPKNLLQR